MEKIYWSMLPLTQIHIKGTIVSLRNILLTVRCVDIQLIVI
jgi:hypothetical protein